METEAAITTSVRDAGPNSDSDDFKTDISWPGLASIFVFYIIILAVGALGTILKKSWKATSEDMMLAGRDIGLVVGIFTMTATWVGGGYINGTAEFVASPNHGLVWCQAPFGYAISLILGGIFYAKKMRNGRYATMLDPFQERYGPVMTSVLYIPALMADVFWSASTLAALGASLTVVVGLDHKVAILVSAAIAILYTLIGGLYSVSLTDVVQLLCLFFGLWFVVPFALNHDAVTSLKDTSHDDSNLNQTGWLGSLEHSPTVGLWVDSGLLLIFGGIPYQEYYQRVLSQRTARRAQILSFVAGFLCFLCALPPVIIGSIYASTNWTETDYNGPTDKYSLALPLVLRYLTPTAVGVIGLGAVSAAVMSSADSTILSSSSMFARNVYQPMRNKVGCQLGWNLVTDREILWVMRATVLVVGGASLGMAIQVSSIYALFIMCSDLVYVILFPQLTCILYFKEANTYGSALGYALGLFFRMSGGEPLIDFPALIEYPWYEDGTGTQNFPFKTMSMLLGFVGIFSGSLLSKKMFVNKKLSAKYDLFRCFQEKQSRKGSNLGVTNRAFIVDDDTPVDLSAQLDSYRYIKEQRPEQKTSNLGVTNRAFIVDDDTPVDLCKV